MKSCPQCNSVFADDYVFCMNDGTTLTDESGEQETLVAQRFSISTSLLSPDMLVECPNCALANRANSKFCKKCGSSVTGSSSPFAYPRAPQDPFSGISSNEFSFSQHSTDFTPQVQTSERLNETVAIDSQIFTPPATTAAPAGVSSPFSKNVVIALLVGAVSVGGFIMYVSNQNPGSQKDTSKTSVAKNTSTTSSAAVANAVNAASNIGPSGNDPRIGKIGTFTTDSNLREYPNGNAYKVGTHYNGARVRVLDSANVTNDDGSTSVWFKIEVLSYGVSLDPANAGFDKDPGSSDTGWVNSYPRLWSPNGYYRVNLVNFD